MSLLGCHKPAGTASIILDPTSLKLGSGKGTKGKITIYNPVGSEKWKIYLWEITKGPFKVIDPSNWCLYKTYNPGESCTVEIEHTEAGTGHQGAYRVVTTAGPSESASLSS